MCDIDQIYPDWFNESWPRARKPHWCQGCSESILVGQRYYCCSGQWDGTIRTHRLCLRCRAIYEGLVARDPYDLVNLTLHCGTYIGDPDDPLQWLAFALPTDQEVTP